MASTKSSPTHTTGGKPFSLVPAAAQRRMYQLLSSLKPQSISDAVVAEVAVCSALGKQDVAVLASKAVGARKALRKYKTVNKGTHRLRKALLTAVEDLMGDATATVAICAGRFHDEENYREAVAFAARHHLPILFVVSNTYTPKVRERQDLRSLYPEFGIPVFSVEAGDAIAAYRVATEALHNARHHRIPCVIEALVTDKAGVKKTAVLQLLQGYMERHGNWPL